MSVGLQVFCTLDFERMPQACSRLYTSEFDCLTRPTLQK